MDTNKKYVPSQYFPMKFVRFASQFENSDDEFEQIIAYLMLDVGVETLLKTYILLPDNVTSSEYNRRVETAKGTVEKDKITDTKITAANFDKLTFHNLSVKVREVAKSKVTKEELDNAVYFHGIRNIIYHEGKKTVPPKKDFYEYLTLAKSLLHKLLDVEWENQETNEVNKKEYYKKLKHKVAIATEIFRPEFATRIIEEKLKIISRLYDEENVRESEDRVITFFNRFFSKLIGREIHDFSFIKKCLDDITFLRLDAIRTEMGLEQNDIEQWLEFKKWATSPIKPIEEFTRENGLRAENLVMWALELERKIDLIFETHITHILR